MFLKYTTLKNVVAISTKLLYVQLYGTTANTAGSCWGYVSYSFAHLKTESSDQPKLNQIFWRPFLKINVHVLKPFLSQIQAFTLTGPDPLALSFQDFSTSNAIHFLINSDMLSCQRKIILTASCCQSVYIKAVCSLHLKPKI